jgi:Ca2+-binding RTX toxin-like protein
VSGALTLDLAVFGPQNTGAGVISVVSVEDAVGSENFDSILRGSTAANFLVGGIGNDTLEGRDGNDTLSGREGNDLIFGGNGSDTLIGDDGNDRLEGGEGSDFLVGGSGQDLILGGAGNDILSEIAFNIRLDADTFDGGDGSDTLRASFGGDFRLATIVSIETLEWDGIADVSIQLRGDQIGGTGLSSALQVRGDSGANALVVDMGTAGTLDLSGFVFTNWSNNQDTVTLNGSTGADTIIGSDRPDTLNGGQGDDALTGGLGNDALNGGAGNDVLNGGEGDDVAAGGAGDDTYFLDRANERVTELAGEGVDEIRTTVATDSLSGTARANVENLTGLLETGQTLSGNALANVITGGGGADRLFGGAGRDELRGGGGDDELFAFAGDVVAGEVYDGGAGTDELYVGGVVDLSATTMVSFERLGFGGGGEASASFRSDQIGSGLSGALAVEGDAQVNNIVVTLVQPGTLDLSGFTFTNWNDAQDTVTVYGSSGGDTITGTSRRDQLLGRPGLSMSSPAAREATCWKAARATTDWSAARAPTCWSATPGTTGWRAARAASGCRATTATTRCWARAAPTNCTAARGPTFWTAATAATSWRARAAPTR